MFTRGFHGNFFDQGDRSLISYFERGREFGVRATSVFSCAINPLKILPYFIYDSIGQSADTGHRSRGQVAMFLLFGAKVRIIFELCKCLDEYLHRRIILV